MMLLTLFLSYFRDVASLKVYLFQSLRSSNLTKLAENTLSSSFLDKYLKANFTFRAFLATICI